MSFDADMRALRSMARRTLPHVSSMLETRGRTVRDSVLVTMDVGRSPGTEIAIAVLAEDECLPEMDARRRLFAKLERARSIGVPSILAAIIPPGTLVASIERSAKPARALRRWLRGETPANHCRLVSIAGARLRMELVPLR